MACNCSTNLDGKAVVDLVRSKGKADMALRASHTIECSCGQSFAMETCVDNCPHCGMTYGVTPCSQDDVSKIQSAGINY